MGITSSQSILYSTGCSPLVFFSAIPLFIRRIPPFSRPRLFRDNVPVFQCFFFRPIAPRRVGHFLLKPVGLVGEFILSNITAPSPLFFFPVGAFFLLNPVISLILLPSVLTDPGPASWCFFCSGLLFPPLDEIVLRVFRFQTPDFSTFSVVRTFPQACLSSCVVGPTLFSPPPDCRAFSSWGPPW